MPKMIEFKSEEQARKWVRKKNDEYKIEKYVYHDGCYVSDITIENPDIWNTVGFVNSSLIYGTPFS